MWHFCYVYKLESFISNIIIKPAIFASMKGIFYDKKTKRIVAEITASTINLRTNNNEHGHEKLNATSKIALVNGPYSVSYSFIFLFCLCLFSQDAFFKLF